MGPCPLFGHSWSDELVFPSWEWQLSLEDWFPGGVSTLVSRVLPHFRQILTWCFSPHLVHLAWLRQLRVMWPCRGKLKQHPDLLNNGAWLVARPSLICFPSLPSLAATSTGTSLMVGAFTTDNAASLESSIQASLNNSLNFSSKSYVLSSRFTGMWA